VSLQFRFAIASDLHIALPQTVWEHPNRFHLVEYGIEVLEVVLAHLSQLDLDFLLLPGDLTQHGEAENHQWLCQRLQQLPYPVYVIPGNHDLPTPESLSNFVPYYKQLGYQSSDRLYYAQEILPGVRLIGLNSNFFAANGEQLGFLDAEQFAWLETELKIEFPLTLVTIHHNLLEHMPGQANNPLGKRYMLENAAEVCDLLHKYQVRLVFTGHLHVQDVAYSDRYNLYEITTGSTVSFPHPYRVLEYAQDSLQIHSFRVTSIPSMPNFAEFSRTWMGDRAYPFIGRLLTSAPLHLSSAEAATYLPELRYFWADLAAGDAKFSFPNLPKPVREYFEAFSDSPPADNQVLLKLSQS
jgi:3',5'-cyclic AMP phosphodiesterase CpdA